MKKIVGDLWKISAQVKVIPTNGMYSNDEFPRAIMGAGVALQASNRVGLLPAMLGHRLKKYGNRLFIFDLNGFHREAAGCPVLVTFPTKDDWRNASTESLITLSCRQLAAAQRMHDWSYVALPAVGMGLGGLPSSVVEPILHEYLSDVFTLVEFERG